MPAAIKDRIVEALDQLYINGWSGSAFSPAQAARNLIDLATGANLGALAGWSVGVHAQLWGVGGLGTRVPPWGEVVGVGACW
jgi:hypothetical protein